MSTATLARSLRRSGARDGEVAAEAVAELSPWIPRMVRWLDDLIRIPGTRIGIGLDSVLGFVLPGVGDALTGTASIILLLSALGRGLPTVVLLRMLLNIGVDVLGGTLPIVGDTFDVFWKCNRRNLELIRRHQHQGRGKAHLGDYLVVGAGVLLALAGIVLPFVVLWLIGWGGFELWQGVFGG